MPKLSKRYFLIDAQHAFIPTEKVGVFIMVHPSVIFISCTWCGAKAGERCKNQAGQLWTSSTHYMRRDDAVELVKAAVKANQKLGKLPL